MADESEQHLFKFLESLGLDMEDPNLKETAKRVTRMYREELLAGHSMDEPTLTTFPTPNVGNQQVTVHDIDVQSMCSHHLMPINGYAHVSCYFLEDDDCNTWLPGLSKYARVTELYSRRLQLQERLTSQIAKHILDNTRAVWVAVQINADHFCMSHRGVRHHNSDTTTTTVLRRPTSSKYTLPNMSKETLPIGMKDGDKYYITPERSELLLSTFLADVRSRGKR